MQKVLVFWQMSEFLVYSYKNMLRKFWDKEASVLVNINFGGKM